MAASGSSNVVARPAIDEISECSGETKTVKYMKAFILQEISESRRLIKVIRDEVDVAKIALGCFRDNKRMMGWKIMGLNQRIKDIKGEIRTFEGHLDIIDATINSD
ncbi:hypothetical protein Tco_1192473 [Tanacetum coccineum]